MRRPRRWIGGRHGHRPSIRHRGCTCSRAHASASRSNPHAPAAPTYAIRSPGSRMQGALPRHGLHQRGRAVRVVGVRFNRPTALRRTSRSRQTSLRHRRSLGRSDWTAHSWCAGHRDCRPAITARRAHCGLGGASRSTRRDPRRARVNGLRGRTRFCVRGLVFRKVNRGISRGAPRPDRGPRHADFACWGGDCKARDARISAISERGATS
jgi:hypothetical protein